MKNLVIPEVADMAWWPWSAFPSLVTLVEVGLWFGFLVWAFGGWIRGRVGVDGQKRVRREIVER